MSASLFIAGGAIAVAAASAAASAASFRSRSGSLFESLSYSPPAGVLRSDLPAVVQYSAQRVGAALMHPPRLVHMEQSGEMFAIGRQVPFTARQIYAVGRTAFAWQAHLKLAAMPLAVIDALVDDQPYMEARLCDVLRLAHLKASDAAYRGQATRYLAELMWNPDGICCNPEIAWRVANDGTFVASLGDGERKCEVRYIANKVGEVERVECDARPRNVGGHMVPTPWRGEYSRYRTIGDRRVPTYAHAAWIVDGAERIYWRGHLESWALGH